MNDLRIAVLGAGMGGLTAAALLAREGACVTVYEQAPAFSRVGAGIQMGPNAVRVLRHLGLEAKIRGMAFQPSSWRNRTWDRGELMNELPLGRAAEERHGAPYLLMHRADLHAALLSCVPDAVLRLGKELVAVDQDAAAVSMLFADGSKAEADILIASDGLSSLVRRSVFGTDRPRYTGRVAYRAVFAAERLGGIELDDYTKWWGEDRHIVIYYLNPRRDEIYFTTSVPDASWTSESWSAAGEVDELRAAFAGFHEHVECVLEACPATHKWAIADRDPMPEWSRGRIILMGDACHPMTPYMAQGAAQAMEDAMIMVRALRAHEFTDVPAAWATYQATRHERASTVQLISHGNRWMRERTDSDWLYQYDACSAPLSAVS